MLTQMKDFGDLFGVLSWRTIISLNLANVNPAGQVSPLMGKP